MPRWFILVGSWVWRLMGANASKSVVLKIFQRWNRQWERPPSLLDYFLWISLGILLVVVGTINLEESSIFWVQLRPGGHSFLGVQDLGNILCSLCIPRTILLTCPIFLGIGLFQFLELRPHVVDIFKCLQRFISCYC